MLTSWLSISAPVPGLYCYSLLQSRSRCKSWRCKEKYFDHQPLQCIALQFFDTYFWVFWGTLTYKRLSVRTYIRTVALFGEIFWSPACNVAIWPILWHTTTTKHWKRREIISYIVWFPNQSGFVFPSINMKILIIFLFVFQTPEPEYYSYSIF